MRSVMWRRVVAATVAVPLLLVGGCGADEPVVRPSVTASEAAPSPTPSPSPTIDLTRLPEQPAAMAEPTTDGAIAAATYVLQLYGYSFASGDLSPWRAITLNTCEFCSAVADAVEAMKAEGETSTGSTVTVTSAEATEISEDRWFSVDMMITQSPSTRYGKDGDEIGHGDGGQFNAVFALSWSDGWRVDEMGVELPDGPVATP